MTRSRSFLSGLVAAVLAGGVAGAGVAALIGGFQNAGWVPSQATAIGACVAGAVGFVAAWLATRRSEVGQDPGPARPLPEPPLEPDLAIATEPPAPSPVPRAAASPDPLPGEEGLLPAAAVRLYGTATSREAAIDEVGQLLVDSGAAEAGYIAAMHDHERASSTHMGNALAVPRGAPAAGALVVRPGLAFVRYPGSIDWYGNRVRFVVAIAAADGADQVRLVSRVAEVFLDDAVVAQLEATGEVGDVTDAFARAGR